MCIDPIPVSMARSLTKPNFYRFALSELALASHTLPFQLIGGGLMDLVALPIAISLYPFGFNLKKQLNAPSGCKRLTLLVHGFLHNQSAWFFIRRKLERYSELGPIFTINLGHPYQSIEDYTRHLSAYLEMICALTGEGGCEINLVGHSMGGLICLNYAASLPEESSIKVVRIVTLASPIQGSSWSCLAKFFPCADEMTPGHPFLQQLHKKVQKIAKTKIFHIGCGGDLIVLKSHTFFPGGGNHREISTLGHLTCLFSSKAVLYIAEGLGIEV